MLRHAIAPSARYTKASHDVVRHPRLSSDAKILLLYVQGLPDTTTFKPLSELAQKLGIKGRAYQKAKQQLVENGYVHEWRSQADGGRWITEQLVANTALTSEQATHVRGTPPTPSPAAVPPSTHSPTVGEPAPRTAGGYEPVEDHSDKTTPHPPSEPSALSELSALSLPSELSPLSEPERPAPTADPALLARAERVLLSLRHSRRELHLGVREAAKLAVDAVKWLERGLSESDLRQALLAERPKEGVRSAVGFLRYRLAQKLPEPRTTPQSFEPARPRELIECQGPGKTHNFRPLLDETECTPCRLTAANTMYSASPSLEPDHLPWRERFAKINTTPTTAPGVG
ncbi:hypothetical protein [Streptomyces sp. NBC_01363]|uniref:hypothetical protein n=1 Tax=Streptomyces sp. NBC_01363 TaxID=2903840 RepID=UPI002255DABB|nr:hypothetical protein [Streptomyces sp. NBC_01363]MCX4731870.1 hypothetical protein [Streptomyces sp. NBC_01363]